MGDIKRKRKLFERPRQLFNRQRMDEENILVKKYGLRAKREIWKAKSIVSKFRKRAKELISAEEEEKKSFFEKLGKIGIVANDISDVLALTEENLLSRRLQTLVFKKKLANTPLQARQLIVHKNVLVDGEVVNSPSYIVSPSQEGKITLKERKVKEKKVEEAAPEEEVASEETLKEESKEETEDKKE